MLDEQGKAHLIDYGISMPYRNKKGDHVPKRKVMFHEGTFSFLSQNQTRGFVASRRDDIESLLYTMLFLLKNKLPWKGFALFRREFTQTREAEIEYKSKRRAIRDSEIARHFPDSLRPAFMYIRRVRFADEPDYSYLDDVFNGRTRESFRAYSSSQYLDIPSSSIT